MGRINRIEECMKKSSANRWMNDNVSESEYDEKRNG